jgi:aspartyl-tRNA(Asn)/glutamyl-tRNA(Gln) amidotransferase subunit A
MTDLIRLTIAEARDEMKKGAFSSIELTDAYLAAIEAANPAINAYVKVTADRHPARDQGPVLHRGRALAGRLPHPRRLRAALRIHRHRQLWADGAVMLGKLNMDEFAMGSSNETSCYGPVINPWRRRGDNARWCPAAPRAARRRRSAPISARRHRHRHRRLDPPARGLHRHRRHQADLWPLLALGHRRLRLLARPGRPDDQDGARRRHHARRDGRRGPEGQHLAPICPVPDFEAALTGDIRGKRIGVPKEYRMEGMPDEIEALWQKGREMLADAGAEIVDISLPHTKYALPAYYIIAPAEASSNLARYDGVRYGRRACRARACRHV